MAAGHLNRIIEIQKRATVSDGYGNRRAAWTTVVEDEPAQIKPLRSGEDVIAARLSNSGICEIKVRYSERTASIKTDYRIINSGDGQIFNIRSIQNNDMRGRYLTLLCEFGVADG